MSNLIRHPNVDAELAAAVQRDERGTETISTMSVAPALRNAVWEARNRSHLIGLKAGSPAATGLVGTMRSAVVNGMSIADISGNAHTVERTPAMARQLQIDSVMFTFVLAGESFHFNGTSPVLVKQGEVAIYDSDNPFLLGFSEGMHTVVVTLPRYHLADIGLQDAFRTLKVLRHSGKSSDSQAARQLLQVCCSAFDRPIDVNPHEFGETLVENTLRAVRQLAGHPQPSVPDYFDSATAFIEAHLDDTNLSVAEVARALNLSQRHLSRVFSARDLTVAHHIQELRLRQAATLLASPEGEHLTAAEIGHRSGFTSASHFSRVFRTHFGMTPTEARRAARHG